MRRLRRLHRLLVLVPLAGCGVGALNQATLGGQCAANDAACARKGPLAPLAIGARFHPDIATSIAGSATPSIVLSSADESVLAVEDGVLVGKAPGASAVLIATDDGSVIDFVHVWVAPITHLTLARRDGERVADAVGLAVGEDVTFVPALWNGPQRLAGDAPVTWTVDNPTAVAILRDGSEDRRRVRARAPGAAHVTAAFGAAQASVAVEVVP